MKNQQDQIIDTNGVYSAPSTAFISPTENLLFRPTLVGEELYTQMGFFVQSILADRYNHRREL